CLPGPPREMEPMLRRWVLPALRRRSPGRPRERTLYASCCGVPESDLADRLADLMARDREVRVGTAVTEGIITVAVHGAGEAARGVGAVHREVLRRLGRDAYAAGRVPLAARLLDLLRERGLTLALAESCTAGLAAARFAETPGASAVLLGGVVAYHDGLKESLLGVPRALLRREGAVSGAVAAAMAAGIRERTGADLAGAVTGVAGPGGGSRRKPVGTVWFAVADRDGSLPVLRRFAGDRTFIRGIASHTLLDLLRRRVEGALPGPPR
ncbi:MAG: nicotinamide-nucleotide amidohydrolase family protein, partial [Planctomycetes bacterium]|nr:nicotinamide-nucleotide amidohydrolase family protein [Planctomycetota bacterium]